MATWRPTVCFGLIHPFDGLPSGEVYVGCWSMCRTEGANVHSTRSFVSLGRRAMPGRCAGSLRSPTVPTSEELRLIQGVPYRLVPRIAGMKMIAGEVGRKRVDWRDHTSPRPGRLPHGAASPAFAPTRGASFRLARRQNRNWMAEREYVHERRSRLARC